jgi:hypothetical protein
MSTTPPQPNVADTISLENVLEVHPITEYIDADIINLPRGKELTEIDAVALSSSRPVEWIVLAGAVDSGKTTLLTSLYELFQLGRVAGHSFAGSLSLPAFEERCHLARRPSQNKVPQTQRTPYESVPRYLHLRVGAETEPWKHTDFLFTDVSGELFRDARDSTTLCKELTFLRRAGNLVLLLDSKHGLRADKRWASIQNAKTLLRSFLDGAMLESDCVVTVVWSRFDYFIAAGNTDEHRTFREEVASSFRQTFGDRILNLKFGEVAARPTRAPSLQFGNGVGELFKGWLSFRPRSRPLRFLPPIGGVRESELFAERHLKAMESHE